MSTKEWILDIKDSVGVYQECLYDFEAHDVNPNDAVIQVDNPKSFTICREEYAVGKAFSQLVVEIPADRFNEIAIAWCKKRKLQGAIGGPVEKEFISPDYENK